ncbi:RNA polymerase sigma factor FliA [Maioricimonas rarisocia]|uniref:RNA polymerase sigma factor FliA n=1 Tax=Maioricimonas rarisocia TaxID=2528026 RepID=A0A517ZCJ9_9PLAN|nr:sigma-70 family RNA polymerase sigma factor [Maioricimonas rarisocia]QDU40224.1 RNA polymerase sigma factor FliA [Maioricimonas rarisocia]
MDSALRTYRDAARKGDRDRLVLEHLEYVRHVVGKLISDLPAGTDLENLEAAGVLGLVEAATQFDAARGVAFTTYAYPRIRGAVLDELRRNSPLSQTMAQRWARIRAASLEFENSATPEALAEQTGLTVEEVEECLQAVRLLNPDSWQDELHTGVSTDTAEAAEVALDRDEEKRVLADAIESLPERERIVITLYYSEDLRLKEIGAVLDMTESGVSRLLARAELQLGQIVRDRLG